MIELQQIQPCKNKSVDGILPDGRLVEFKSKTTCDFEKLIRLMVAMANEKGGFIIFGIEDGTKRIIGLKESLGFCNFVSLIDFN